MILSILIFWLTISAIFKDCELDFDFDLDKNFVVIDLRVRKCEFSTLFGCYTWNFSASAQRPPLEEAMPLTVSKEVLKQDLKVMLKGYALFLLFIVMIL